MAIKYFLIILFFLSYTTAEENGSQLDIYQRDVSKWILTKSNNIDSYFFKDTNETLRNKTYAELKTSLAMESKSDVEYDVTFKIRLRLPKMEKHFKLILEDSDDRSEDGTDLGTNHQLENKDYHIRLEYFDYIQEKLHFNLGGGLRFRKMLLYPYLNLKATYTINDDENYKSEFYNRFRLYVYGDIENIFEYNFIYHLNKLTKNFYFSFHNQIEYKDKEENEKLTNDIALIKIIDKKNLMKMGYAISSEIENFKKIDVDYYQYYFTYRQVFYKDWLYYQATPSMLWRDRNDFESSYRFMVNVGMVFK